MAGVGGVGQDPVGFGSASAICNVFDGGERGPDDLLRCPHHPLQRLPVRSFAATTPDRDAVSQQALDGPSVEGRQDGRREGGSAHPPQEVQALLCLLRQGGGGLKLLSSFDSDLI